MNTFEESLYKSVVHNSLLFLEEGVKRMVKNGRSILEDTLVLSCTNIQISLELAMRAYLVRVKGLDSILNRKQQGKFTDEEKAKLYQDNKLKVVEFDGLKNQLKGKEFDVFKKEDFTIIDEFQTLRNKMVHFCCFLEEGELFDLREKLMFYVVRVVLCLLYDKYEQKRPAEYFVELLGWDFYQTLINDRGYIRAIEQLAKENAKKLGLCPICSRYAYSIDEEFCYFCNVQPQEGDWGRTDCIACGSNNTVIYDKLNIHLKGNHHSMPGMCQLCEEHLDVFECPICGQSHCNFGDQYDWMCYDGHCTTVNEDYSD